MTTFSLKQAADEAGVSKSTIWRAVKSGRLSASRDDDGGFTVDASELHRVFQVKRIEPRGMTQDAALNATYEAQEAADTALRLAVAETKIEALHAMLEELRRARDSWQAQAERLALMAPTVIAAPVMTDAPAPNTTSTTATISTSAPNTSADEPEPRRSWIRYWFGLRAAG
jgi:hypothetical protein